MSLKNVTVTVQELTKYGYKAEGRYVNFSKNLSETDKQTVVPGASFEAEYYVSPAGKEYLNKVTKGIVPAVPAVKVEAPKVTAPVAPAVDKPRAAKYTPKFVKKDDTMSKDEWAAKDRRISRQGAIQAAVQALAPVVSLETLLVESVKLAEGMLEFVNTKE